MLPLFLALRGSGTGAVGMEVIGKIMLLLSLPNLPMWPLAR